LERPLRYLPETLGLLLRHCLELSTYNPDRHGSLDRTSDSIGFEAGRRSTHRSTRFSHQRRFSKDSSGFSLQTIFVMQPAQNRPTHYFLIFRKIVAMLLYLVVVYSWLVESRS